MEPGQDGRLERDLHPAPKGFPNPFGRRLFRALGKRKKWEKGLSSTAIHHTHLLDMRCTLTHTPLPRFNHHLTTRMEKASATVLSDSGTTNSP